MTSDLRIGLLGSRFMGRAHSNAWSQAGRFFDLPLSPTLAVVSARDADHLADFATRWGWDRWTTDWTECVAADDVDLVDIGTPNHLHAEQAIAALRAGKHVACEKPLAGTLDDARAMRTAASEATGSTFVWFTYRRVPAVALARQLVVEGRIGRIYHVRAAYLQGWGGPEARRTWRFRGDLAGSGAHGDLNAHIIDLTRFLTGEEIVEVGGAVERRFIDDRPLPEAPDTLGPSTVDDSVAFLARLAGGALATFEATRLATGVKNSNRIEIHGESGSIRFDFERMNELAFFDRSESPRLQGWKTILTTHEEHPYAGSWWPDGHWLGYEHTFVNQAADIVKAIGGGEPEAPLPDFADAFETQRVMEAALLSARRGAPVEVPEVE